MSEKLSENNGFTERYNMLLAYFELTPKGLADALGSTGHVKFNNYVHGIGKPSAETLIEIARKFPVSLDWLLLGDGSMMRTDVLEAKVVESEQKQPETNYQVQLLKEKHTNDLLRQENKMLKAENQKVWRMALPESVQKELDFPKSDSQSTDDFDNNYKRYVRAVVAGFLRKDQEEATNSAQELLSDVTNVDRPMLGVRLTLPSSRYVRLRICQP